MNYKKIFNRLALTSLMFTTFSSFANDLVNINTTLNYMLSPLDNAQDILKSLYETSGGKPLPDVRSLIARPNGVSANDYLESLLIDKNYNIHVQIKATQPPGFNSIAATLLNKKFVFSPRYNPGDAKVTAFECYTNFDEDLASFEGATTTPIGELSAITIKNKDSSENIPNMFQGCKYLPTSSLPPIVQ